MDLQHRRHNLLRRHLRRLSLPGAGVVDHCTQFRRGLANPFGKAVNAFMSRKIALNASCPQSFQLFQRRVIATVGNDNGDVALQERPGQRQPNPACAARDQHWR
ncbi:hypothetical protein D3C87_1858330 [compost metagenome]